MIKEKLIKAMKRKGLKQLFVAEQMGISEVYLSRILNSNRPLPKRIGKKLCEYLL